MDQDRIDRARARMDEDGLVALVCRLPENVVMLSGHWPLIGWSFLLFPREGRPLCIVPRCDEAEARDELWDAECVPFPFGVLAAGDPYEGISNALKRAARGKGWARVGYEGGFESVAPPWNAAEPAIPAAATRSLLEDAFGAGALVDATRVLTDLRACKTIQERAGLRRANEISTFGLKAFVDSVEVGARGVDLVARVEYAIMTSGTGNAGAKRVRAFAQVSTGPAETAKGYRPMVISTDRALAVGDPALLELGVVVDGFWCDRTRVRVAGEPTSRQREAFAAVVEAQGAAIARVRAGVTAGEVDAAARTVLRDAGYEKEFLHVTGHGVGFRYHEPVPLICPGSEEVLRPGMVHTVEPGVYTRDMGGMRVEDNVIVTERGSEVLGPFPKELSA